MTKKKKELSVCACEGSGLCGWLVLTCRRSVFFLGSVETIENLTSHSVGNSTEKKKKKKKFSFETTKLFVFFSSPPPTSPPFQSKPERNLIGGYLFFFFRFFRKTLFTRASLF